MKQKEKPFNKRVSPQTAHYIQALEQVLNAEDLCLCAYSDLYGYGDGEDEGIRSYQKSELSSIFEELKDAIRRNIGVAIEVNLTDLNKDLI